MSQETRGTSTYHIALLIDTQHGRTVIATAVASAVILAACIVALCSMPTKAFAAHSVHLKDGDVFDLSQVTDATHVYVDTSGEFRLTGSSNKVLVDVQVPEGQYAVIYLDGVTLTPNGDAPGASDDDRSAITVKDTKNGGGAAYGVGDSVVITEIGEVVTLYAQWQRSEYLICFMPNGGELESGKASCSQIVSFGSDAPLETPAMQLRARHLIGWNTKPNGTGTAYGLGESVRNIATNGQGAVYLYAQWGVDVYTVNYDGNGAEGSMDSDVFECGIAHLIPNRGFSREGYTFAGWNTLPDGSGTALSPEGSYADLTIAGESVTLYAQWTNDNPDPGPDPAPTPDPDNGADDSAATSGVKDASDTLADTDDDSATVLVALAALALACATACSLLYRRHLS